MRRSLAALRLSPVTAAVLAAMALAMAAVAVVVMAMTVIGADPSAVPAEVLTVGDLRSDGEGPGLVGNPLLILAAVVGLGLATAGVTALLVRLTQHD